MSDAGIEPTYVGKNKNLVFVVPKELFNMSLGPAEVLDRESAKLFSKYIRGTFKGFQQARKTKYGNENNINTEVGSDFWENFETKCRELDMDLIGYTPVNENYIFKDLKVYGKNAIILGMEMKWDKIKGAPSAECEIEVFRVYKELGDVTIELAEYLKSMGYKVTAELIKRGYYPKGGGEAILTILPYKNLHPLVLDNNNISKTVEGIVHVTNLPEHIGTRIKHSIIKTLHKKNITISLDIKIGTSFSTGTGVTIWLKTGKSVLGVVGLGERGISLRL